MDDTEDERERLLKELEHELAQVEQLRPVIPPDEIEEFDDRMAEIRDIIELFKVTPRRPQRSN